MAGTILTVLFIARLAHFDLQLPRVISKMVWLGKEIQFPLINEYMLFDWTNISLSKLLTVKKEKYFLTLLPLMFRTQSNYDILSFKIQFLLTDLNNFPLKFSTSDNKEFCKISKKGINKIWKINLNICLC